MLFAGMTTILIACAFREEATEDAMLGMEHWQMLIGYHLDTLGTNALGQACDLGCIEIVGWRNTLQIGRASCRERVLASV